MVNEIQGATGAAKEISLSRLKRVCAEFEGVFLNYMAKAMRSSLAGGGMLGRSHQGEIFGSLLDDKMTSDIARKRGIGLGDLIYQKLRSRASSSHESPGRSNGTQNDSYY